MGTGLSRPSPGRRLLKAAGPGDEHTARTLLDDFPKVATFSKFAEGTTALHIAAAEGHLELLATLVSAAWEQCRQARTAPKARKLMASFLNHRAGCGYTALMLACKNGQCHVVRWLLQIGADPLLADHLQSRTCLHFAALHGSVDCIRALLADDASDASPAGIDLLRDGDDAAPSRPERAGLIDRAAAGGYTALHMAVAQGHAECAQALLQAGAHLSVCCHGNLWSHRMRLAWRPGSTVLHIAAASGSFQMVQLILQECMARRAADIRGAKDCLNNTAFDLAVASGFLFLRHSLDPATLLEPAALLDHRLTHGPLTLRALCSAALRSRLLVGLDHLNHLDHPLPSHAASSSLTGMGPVPFTAPLLMPADPKLQGALAPHSAASVAASQDLLPHAASDQDCRPECTICFDRPEEVAAEACGHASCAACARQLCRQGPEGQPPSCAFCRRMLTGFCSLGAGQAASPA